MESWREELYAMDYSNYLEHIKLKGIKNGEGVAYTRLPDGTYVRTEIGKQRKRDRENIKGNGLGAEDAWMKNKPKAARYFKDLNSSKSNQEESKEEPKKEESKEEPKKEKSKEEPKKEESKEEPKKEKSKEEPKKEKSKEEPKNEKTPETYNKASTGGDVSVKNLNSSIKTIITGIDNKRIADLPDADLSKYSNDELEAMTKRANLETNYRKATAPGESKTAKGAKAVTDIMTGLIGASIAGMAIAKVYKILKD